MDRGSSRHTQPRHVAYYRRRALGGAGLIIVEPLFVDPAGMQAALSAHRAGYQVTLFERSKALGGQFAYAPLMTGKEAMQRPFGSLVRAVERSGLEARTGFEATVERITELEPDRVLAARSPRTQIVGREVRRLRDHRRR